MCTVSFDKVMLNMTIHNQYSGLELVSPVYCSNSTIRYVSPSQKVDTGNTIEASFGIDSREDDAKGIVLYKLQRKHTTKIDNHSSSNNTSIEDTATNMYLLIAWNVKNCFFNSFYMYLIECANDFIWDEAKLWALHWEYNYQFVKNYRSNIITWLMNDSEVMKMRLNITYGSNYKLDIVISEGTGKYDMKRPVQIDLERLVLLLSMLIALMYAISLPIRSSFKLGIHNQCLNVDLVSPTYIIHSYSECHRAPGYKICSGDAMRFGFIIDSYDVVTIPTDTSRHEGTSYGALIYRLQRRPSHEFTEISKGASRDVHLLVVWRILKYKILDADILLVEHDKGFVWNKDDLRKLYSKNTDRFKWLSCSAAETWSLNNNIALMIASEIMNEDLVLNIIVSEVEGGNFERTPISIDMKR
jgi:hypothetical protein